MQRVRNSLVVALWGALCFANAQSAQAHFLFIRIGPHAEAGRFVEVYFSEYADAGDPRFVGKVAHTRLWSQTGPDVFKPLTVRTATDRLKAPLPASGTVSVVGECRYGVLQRDVPFLLRYFPKAVSGKPDQLNGLRPRSGAPLEIQPTFGDGRVTFVALKNGRPVPGATFTTVDQDLANTELQADDQGRVTWTPPAPGYHCVYTKSVTRKPGELDGRRYDEIRDFATVAFSWPLDQSASDEQAVVLFEQAIAARATWKNFPGFSAQVSARSEGLDVSGSLRVDADGSVTLDVDEDAAAEWLQGQIESLVLHRMDSGPRRERPSLRFADEDSAHPLGRLLIFHGGHFASSYRVKDREITVVNRNLGQQNMTITVLETHKTPEGKSLPKAYTVQYWNAQDGRLLKTQSFTDEWQRVGQWDLPVRHTVTTADDEGLSVREFRLSELQLLEKSP